MSKTEKFLEGLNNWVKVFMHHAMHEMVHWMSENDLSRTQYSALMQLHHHGPSPITNIGTELDISTPAASQLVDRLVQRELLERTEDPVDRRVKMLALSKKGQELILQSFKARLSWTEILAEDLSEDDIDRINLALEILVDKTNNLEQEVTSKTKK